jgi:hypothetical protein
MPGEFSDLVRERLDLALTLEAFCFGGIDIHIDSSAHHDSLER